MRSPGKRWPPLVATAVAAVLVFLVLPNPLRIPQQNPTASAEYAPVPGRTQQSGQSNFAETNLATSSGIGASGEGIGALPGQLEDQLPPQFKPRQKQCVGNPPRQTEDPLSPPCVAFFEGDNGGATYRGVTKDEITVVFYNDRCCDGDLTEPWKPSDEGRCTYSFECENIVRTVKAQLRYFQKRYQTYGRTVKLVAQKSSGDVGAACPSRQGDAQQAEIQWKPFAVVHATNGSAHCYALDIRRHDVASFGLEWPITRDMYEKNRPYIWGFLPDFETMTQWSAGFICNKLRGGEARFSPDPTLQSRRRTFGFIRPNGDGRGPELRTQADLLQQELQKQCNMEFDEVKVFDGTRGAGAGGPEAPQIMTDLKREGVTTVVCYCLPIPTESTAPTMQKQATSINYFPEWYWDSAARMDQPVWVQEFGSDEQVNFGSTLYWRNPAFREQYHYQAYLAEEPGTTPNGRFNFETYHLLLNLFQAIQAAGPDLNPETVERGMFTFNYLERANPYIPMGGYGAYNPNAIATYTFVDTAMGFWWDPTGTPPGGKRGEGCNRVMRQGLRFFWNQWPAGDGDMLLPSDPCTEDVRELVDPGSSTSF